MKTERQKFLGLNFGHMPGGISDDKGFPFFQTGFLGYFQSRADPFLEMTLVVDPLGGF